MLNVKTGTGNNKSRISVYINFSFFQTFFLSATLQHVFRGCFIFIIHVFNLLCRHVKSFNKTTDPITL